MIKNISRSIGRWIARHTIPVECYWDAEDREYGHAALCDALETRHPGSIMETEVVAVVDHIYSTMTPDGVVLTARTIPALKSKYHEALQKEAKAFNDC